MEEPDDLPAAVKPLRLASRDGTPLHASLWEAARPTAGLLFVHGLQSHSGWFEASGTAAELAAAGIAGLAFDRRGSGRSGGGPGDAPSAEAFLEDLDAARAALERHLAERGAAGAPLHALANCFGTRSLFPYLLERPGAFRSAVVTAPAIRMSPRADYGLAARLRILTAPGDRRFRTPLSDDLFVSSGPALDWIRADALSLREVTARFLRSAALLTRRMKRAARRLEVPMLVVLGSRDAMVVNRRIRSDFVERYRGPIEVIQLDAEHYVDFTDQQPALAASVRRWVQRHPAEGTA